jgi:hypothetical protein
MGRREKKDLMRILRHIVALSVACTAVAAASTGCTSSTDTETDETIESQSQALPKAPGGGGEDPVPRCIPRCVGKACGASDGCGKTCTAGSCPAGTACGGGGTPNVCACKPNCAEQACGAADGCGGTCSAGACATGSSCGIGGTPNQCAPIPLGQGVECFVFNDGYAFMAGPSSAITFSPTGLACIPDGSTTGNCRKWFGRCQTTDSSHTPVTFQVGTEPLFTGGIVWSGSSDAVFSRHYKPDIFSSDRSQMCIPDGGNGDCRDVFGNATMQGGRPVRCRLFNDGGSFTTGLTPRMVDTGVSTVWGSDVGGATRKWFGMCEVGGCGDGICDASESFATCSSDCTCGNDACDSGETPKTCPRDCGTCGDGVCNAGENAATCAQDCTRCGDGICSGKEACSSCPGDCGACAVPTCSGDKAGPSATTFVVAFEDGYSCGFTISVFANDRSEAESCVEKAGGTVISKPTATTRYFHTDPKNGCSTLELRSFSDESATRCAAAQGYTLPGACP